MPRVVVTRGRVIASLVFVVGIVAFLYFGLPKLVGFSESIKRLREGNAWWLAGPRCSRVARSSATSRCSAVVFVQRSSRIGWNASYQITMAGLAATRLFAAAGAGGIALTAWALRRSGMERRLVASRMVTFMVLLYGVYMAALVVDGVGLYLGVFARVRAVCDHDRSGDLWCVRDHGVPVDGAAAARLRSPDGGSKRWRGPAQPGSLGGWQRCRAPSRPESGRRSRLIRSA